MRIGLFGNEYQKKETIENIFDVLISNQVKIFVHSEFYTYLFSLKMDLSCVAGILESDYEVLDMAFSIGGDGTFLRTVSALQKTNIPILGINTGRLGFLSEISSKEIGETIAEILNNNYDIESRSQIKLTIECKDGEQKTSYALNEVAILKQDLASMITVTMYINGELLSSYEADGLVVATPTGSTAYSLSVGGAIMAPNTSNFIITAIAPHSLTSRPLVIEDSNILTMEVESRSCCFLVSVDGRSKIFSADTVLKIEKADDSVRVVKRKGHTFYKTLRNKLMWGADPRQDAKKSDN